ncbi:hypothetical protein [Spelaeicoccus albus]|uniref:Uncharacterized protein n=1 Tax=Spelaeicoccus albus TaxID=1280376 RepID=A0A7Z0ABF5_9MICO|nr:hypothetical protein [Spelaeicoccus albus]NYI66081.1 hypothetical protein [Spelaeicoccus albus]
MNAAKKSPSRTVVGVSFQPDELKDLERQRAVLGVRDSGQPKFSLAGTVKLLWEKFGDEAVAVDAQQQVVAEADARVTQPLIDALDALATAWNRRAHQRQAIGVLNNQIAKFVNAQQFDDDPLSTENVERLILALQGIKRRLDDQSAAEREDDQLLAAVRALVDQAASRS